MDNLGKRAVSGIMFTLFLIGTLTFTFNIQPGKAWTGTVYIRADGSIDPPDAPIITYDNVTYTLTDNITSSTNGIVVERDNIVVYGAGYTIQGTGSGTGIVLSGRNNVTIRNTNVKEFGDGVNGEAASHITISGNSITNNSHTGIALHSGENYHNISGNSITMNKFRGIYLAGSWHNSICGNNITNNGYGIYLYSCAYNTISRNTIANNSQYGITLEDSSIIDIFHNNFLNNTNQISIVGKSHVYVLDRPFFVWDNGYPSGGNYWSDYTGMDEEKGPKQDQPGSDGIGDTAYVIDENNTDRYPLMNPWTPSWVPPEYIPSSSSEAQVGIKAGDWIKVDYTVSGWPSGQPYPEWLKVEFLTVEGTNATVRVTMHMSDRTDQNDTVPVIVGAGGGEAFGLSGFVIPANLTAGGSVYISGYRNITIEGETTRTYAGASRTVVYASFSQYGTQLTYYWDKQTGVMVEASSSYSGITATAKATETNMWEAAPPTSIWMQWWLWAIVAIIIIALASAIHILKKRSQRSPV